MGVRVALVHDYLTQFGGAEQVLAALQRVFPDATTFTTLYDPAADLPGIDRAHVDESRLGKVRWFRQHHRAALPLFPMAMRDIRRRLDDYDVVIADSSAWAHQIKPKPGQAFVVYCHSPARFLYGDADYLGATGVEGLIARAFHSAFAPFRWLDRRAYRRADVVLANSRQVAGRLAKRIGISASVLNPPIDVAQFVPVRQPPPEDWYLVVSRLVPHKRIDLVVETATAYGIPVKIIGAGRDLDRLKAMAAPTVEFLGFRPHAEVIEHYQRCRAFILPGVEDFGMTAVEAQASGRPVIAFGRGGALESVQDGITGVLFDAQTPESLLGAMKRLDGAQISREACICNARRFDESVFRDGMLAAVEQAMALSARRTAVARP
ncbi:MAG TPA: glycosyltransferase [Thermomicrobiales bacterium]|nr:glycosyltransferase [Thermomicrobiales bacterium]